MPWKEMTAEEIADVLDISIEEVREKQRLMALIKAERTRKKMTQVEFAKILGVSQGRIAQIESGMGTARVTYEVLFDTLNALGYECKILPYVKKKKGQSENAAKKAACRRTRRSQAQ